MKTKLAVALISALTTTLAIYFFTEGAFFAPKQEKPVAKASPIKTNTNTKQENQLNITMYDTNIVSEEYTGSNEWMTKDTLLINDVAEPINGNRYRDFHYTIEHRKPKLLYHIKNNGNTSFNWIISPPNELPIATGTLKPGEKKTLLTHLEYVPTRFYRLYIATDNGSEGNYTFIADIFEKE